MSHLLVVFLVALPGLVWAAPAAPTGLGYAEPSWTLDGTLPAVIYDDGAEAWLVDAWLGNLATKSLWYDGPRREVGGLHVPTNCVQGGGSVWCAFAQDGSQPQNVVEVDETTGAAQMLLHWTGAYSGPTEEVQGGYPFWNPYNSTLYLTGPYCLRRVVDDGDGTRSVEVVAGECGTICVSSCDGTGAAARFKEFRGWAALSDGSMYFLETGTTTLRKVTPAGVVTTITPTRGGATPLWNLAAGHYDFLSPGDDASTLYLADNYNTLGYTVQTINVSTGAMTHLAGVLKADDTYSRHGSQNDGPALTHASTPGMRGVYSPFYGTYFMDGNDALRLRRVVDGWVKTCLLSTRPGTTLATYNATVSNGEDVPGEQARLDRILSSPISNYAGVDDRGGLFIRYSRDLNGIWRAYNTLEGGSQ